MTPTDPQTEDQPDAAAGNARERNRLLRAFPADAYAAIAPYLETVKLKRGAVIAERGDPVEYAYFPHRSVLSLVTPLSDGTIVESATVGYEGVVGLFAIMGDGIAFERVIAQVPDSATRLPAGRLGALASEYEPVRSLLFRYAQALFRQTAQSLACLQHHSIEERCARWLLQTHDRVGADEFSLTQAFLAAMLGVRRASVNAAAGKLQAEGYIQYQWGRIRVTDRAGLESAACECYGIIAETYSQFLPTAN
jgi:CRP-like cAMP-binding protein